VTLDTPKATRPRLNTMLRARLAAGLLIPACAIALAPAPAMAQATRGYDIPAGALASALNRFAEQSGVQLLYDAPLAQGRHTPGLRGSFATAEGLARLLAGSGLAARQTGPGVFTLEAAPPPQPASGPAPAAVQLGTVQVEATAIDGDAQPQTATGHVKGYVATHALSATKSDTPILTTPQAISVVTSDQIAAQGAQSVPQALRYTSGVQAEQRGVNTDGEEYVYGRGFRLEEYLDGLILPDVGYNIASYEPYTLERIEVLHGPASVLYGQAYPGGIVNLVSKLPGDTPVHEVQIGGGSYGRIQGGFDLGDKIDSNGDVTYRVTGLARTSGTQIAGVRTERYAFAPSVKIKIDANTDLTLLANAQYDPKAGFYNFVPSQGTVSANPNGQIPTSLNVGDPAYDRHSRMQWGGGYKLEHRIGDVWTLRQNLRYTHIEDKLDAVLAYGLAADNRSLNRYAFTNHESLGQIALDNQAQAKFSTGALQHTVIVGLDYRKIDYTQSYGFNFATPALDVFAPAYGAAITTPAYSGIDVVGQDQLGLYAQDQIHVGRLDLLAGVRQDWAGSTDRDLVGGTVTKQDDQKLTWRLGAVYSLPFGLSPYVSYATSFQPETGVAYNGSAFKPTTGKQVEAGLKYQPQGFKGFITVALFNLRQQNVTTPDPDPTHTGFSVQTGEIRSRGVEFEAHANPVPQLSLIASYTYLDNKVTKSNDTDDAYGNNLGATPFGVPGNQASGWADYRFDQGPLKGLKLGGGVRYVGATWGDSLNSFKVGSYTLVDALLSYDLARAAPKMRNWVLSVNASNLFDKTYVSYCQSASLCAYGLRRNVLATLAYKW
jgi:iron complex outermembrane recepter protein